MEDLIKQYLTLVGGWKVLTIAVLIGVDAILGIGSAIKAKTFKWSKIADFMNTDVLMMFGGYFVLGIAALAEPLFQAAVPASMAVIDVKLIADIVNKFKNWGLPVKDT